MRCRGTGLGGVAEGVATGPHFIKSGLRLEIPLLCLTWNGRLLFGFAAGEGGAAVVCEGRGDWVIPRHAMPWHGTGGVAQRLGRGWAAAGGAIDLDLLWKYYSCLRSLVCENPD